MHRQKNRTIKAFKILATLVAGASCSFASASLSSAAGSDSSPEFKESYSLSGVLRSYSNTKPDVYSESWVLVSSQGMRVTDDVTQSEIIKNFTENRVWLQDHRTKLRHEIDVAEFTESFPDLTRFLVGRETQSNVLGAHPCADWTPSFNGERVWRGMVVQDWSCKEDTGVLINTQYFSEQFGMVVRVVHPDSMVEEFRNIAQRESQAEDFQPDGDFKQVDYFEFANMKTTLEKFDD